MPNSINLRSHSHHQNELYRISPDVLTHRNNVQPLSVLGFDQTLKRTTMIYGLIPLELHKQLLDRENYQNRTKGVEELKSLLSELEMQTVSFDSVVEFISFLHKLLDDTNFKVLYGTLQVLNVLVQKLDDSVDQYYKQIVYVALKTLGDTRTVSRNEYMSVFRQLMRIVGPQKVLDLVTGHLKHKHSRVREDVLNIIIAAMLEHPRKDFNIPHLCFLVAPYLADGKKRVRHAALELFAVFDSCLDTGIKQTVIKAIDRVELNGDAEGLQAAIQARKARHILPRLSADGTVEYALVIPKPGQRRSPQFGSGADLDWILYGGRMNSARSYKTDVDSEGLSAYNSLGSLTDEIPLQRRVVSAGKAKNKLPWERLSLPCAGSRKPYDAVNGKLFNKSSLEDLTSSMRLNQETCVTHSGLVEPLQSHSSGQRRETADRRRRSGSLDSNPDIFKVASSSDAEKGVPRMGQLLGSGNPNVERIVSLPSNTTPPGSFLLPSYPLTTLPRVQLTPTLSRRCQADSTLSMSNTWPNNREMSPHRRVPSPWRNNNGETGSTRCSPMDASQTCVVSSSSFPQDLNAVRSSRPSPVTQLSVQDSGNRRDLCNRNLHLDLTVMNLQEPDEEPVDKEECAFLQMNSQRSLHNTAAKKRAKVNMSDSELDPDSPDSAVKLEPNLDSSSRTSPSVTSPMSESSLSSLYSPTTPTINETKNGPGNSTAKTHIAGAPSRKKKNPSPSSMEANPQGVQQEEKLLSDASVGVVGQRVSYCHGAAAEETPREVSSPPQARAAGRNQPRALRPAKGSQIPNTKASPVSNMSEGIVGRGVFGSMVLLNRTEQDESINKATRERPARVYGNAVSGSHVDSDDSHEPDEATEKVKMRQCLLEQQEAQPTPRMRRRLRCVITERASDEAASLKELQLNGSILPSVKPETLTGESSISPTSPEGPQNPQKFACPHHPLSLSTGLPSKCTLPRRRTAPSLIRARPLLFNSSDEIMPVTPKKSPDEQVELEPFSSPELALTQSLELINSNDWKEKIEGLMHLRCLAQHHSDVLCNRVHDICFVLIQEVQNLRSGVSRIAVVTLGELYLSLQKGMDQELEVTAKVLLHKAGETSAFIRQDVDAALDSMVQNCTPTRSMNALLAGGLGHLNAVVRKCTAQHLTTVIEKIGTGRLLSGTKDLTDRILHAVAKLAHDASRETRYFGRQMLLFLSSHHDFDKMLEKFIPTKDVATIRDTVIKLKSKELNGMSPDNPSARGQRARSGRGMMRTPSLTRKSQFSGRDPSKAQLHSFADKLEYVKQLRVLLASKDFQERLKGIDQLVVDCEENPSMVICNMVPVFDTFKERLEESNSKVNLSALEALPRIITLLKDNMAQVVYFLFPAIVDNHLNSRNNSIYTAATAAIQALINNIDNALLLQLFCTKAQFLNGKAKLDLVDRVSELVRELYPRRPQLVEKKALPLLWHLLGSSCRSSTVHGKSSTVIGAATNLCQALHSHMGPMLLHRAASQPAGILKILNKILQSLKGC
ncbi:TOG array regulator of axonemal microtubules protein 1 isoform X2 [Neoarius graeffei]|uniref:TOG array regulator of axonemal microtubules protein 1 isoform X2 n=1 Tax=Neoarius graeffei TaxID=443677 RepID=UPI00298BEAAD|nr:TOG array regulator of axonemal microtubules protein 1 isoform X2 [Neoarius graeffei]